MRIVTLAVTEAGRRLSDRLPFEHRPGPVVDGVAQCWGEVEAMVIIGAVGIAVRAIAPHLHDKSADPAVVCVDDAGRHVVALAGGHRGANGLAGEVASVLGAEPVISTATDLAGLPALDNLPGFVAEGDLAEVTRLWLDGRAPTVEVDPALAGWPPPGGLKPATGGSASVVISDRLMTPASGRVLLRPPSLIVGVGASTGASPEALAGAVQRTLGVAGLSSRSVARVATLDRKTAEPAVRELARNLRAELVGFPAGSLAGKAVPNPSDVVRAAVGTPSVAEAAALTAGGPSAELVCEKTVSATGDSTVAIARRRGPSGHLAVVGLGPGRADQRTLEAVAAVRRAEVIIGYGPYVDQAGDLLMPAQEVIRSPIGSEEDRARSAVEMAAAGRHVALVCSGDAGVYAMASLVLEVAPAAGNPPVTVVPGVTASLSGAAVLGAPLGHDHASISLSDLLTPWEEIERRLEAAARGDFVVSLYNPRSHQRDKQLPLALAILGRHRPPGTPAAVLTDIGRPGQAVVRTTLADLDPEMVGMLSLVIVGSSRTVWIGDRMVTPRGYLP